MVGPRHAAYSRADVEGKVVRWWPGRSRHIGRHRVAETPRHRGTVHSHRASESGGPVGPVGSMEFTVVASERWVP